MRFKFNDGGRAAAGYVGRTGDCVARSIAIAAELPYGEVYERLAQGNASQRKSKRSSRATGKKTAGEGIQTQRTWFKSYMAELGFRWVSTMGIGTGCRVHLREEELPEGRIVVALSRHYAAVIDGVLHDTYEDSRSRDGSRCVYGYWIRDNQNA